MKKVMVALIIIALSFGAFACKPSGKIAKPDFRAAAGVYTGQIPGADVPGIDVQFTLNADGTYELVYNYGEGKDPASVTGVFTAADGIVKLDVDPAAYPAQYKIGEGVLIQLDLEGNEITGDLAENYVLKKAGD